MSDTATKPHRPTELQCQTTIVDAAKRGGWLVHAERTSRTQSGRWATAIQGHAGFPDLVLLHRDRGLLFCELKRKPNRIEPAQQAWIGTLQVMDVPVRVVWVPEQMREFCTWLVSGGAVGEWE